LVLEQSLDGILASRGLQVFGRVHDSNVGVQLFILSLELQTTAHGIGESESQGLANDGTVWQVLLLLQVTEARITAEYYYITD